MQGEREGVGGLVRQWRQQRGLSQLALADRAEVSTRHLSFVETGKSSPSREMVLVLASALEVPLRERNRWLLAAGFAPVYRERDFTAPEMGELRAVLELVLAQHEPFPALVVDRSWQVLMANRGATRVLLTFAADPDVLVKSGGNGIHAIFREDGLRSSIVNWEEVAAAMLHRLRREAFDDPSPDGVVALLAALERYAPLPSARATDPDEPRLLIPVHLRKGSLELRFVTTIASMGTPVDLTAHELRIETYYPLDAATRAWAQDS